MASASEPGGPPALLPDPANNASHGRDDAGSPLILPPFDAKYTFVAGYRTHWTWRCESCGRLSLIHNLGLLEDIIRLLMQAEHIIRAQASPPTDREMIGECENCKERAHWRHIASEIQVNRALKAPHELFNWDAIDQFRQLQTRDHGQDLRLLDPASGVQAASLQWMRMPYIFIHGGARNVLMFQSPESPSKLPLEQIKALERVKALTKVASGGETHWKYWNEDRMLD